MGSVLARRVAARSSSQSDVACLSRAQLVAERRCLLGPVPWRGTSLGRAFRAGLPRGWHAVLPIILPAGEFPCWWRWRACLVVALRDDAHALSLDRACAGLWTLFLEAGALCQSELQVEGAMTIYRSLLRSREGWRLMHGPAAAEVAFSLTHSFIYFRPQALKVGIIYKLGSLGIHIKEHHIDSCKNQL